MIAVALLWLTCSAPGPRWATVAWPAVTFAPVGRTGLGAGA
jgi:hypothetical protein